MDLKQQTLKLGLDLTVRELTPNELHAQHEVFALAERFYTYVDHRIDGKSGFPEPTQADRDLRVEAMRDHAYQPPEHFERAVNLKGALQLKADIFLLTATLAADVHRAMVATLSRVEVLDQIRVLCAMPLDENDVPEEQLQARITAIMGLLDGGRSAYVGEVVERIEAIISRDRIGEADYEGPRIVDNVMEAVTEALTVG